MAAPGDSTPDKDVSDVDSFIREAARIPDATPAPDRTGHPLGPFLLRRKCGQGAMGVVYAAEDLRDNRPVAVKVLPAAFAADPQRARRFASEAAALASLDHPAIVRYVDHGHTPAGEPFLAMEWLDGEDLAERLQRGALGIDESAALGRRVAEALAAAHARGIVHRDIKPSNLFLRGGDVEKVTVVDFGIARIEDARTSLTGTGMLIGTPGYMAPEQARGSSLIDARVDVFALGAVMFECLAGRPAFSGHHVMAVLAKVLLEDPPHLTRLRSEVPRALADLVGRMLAKEATERVQSAAAVADELTRIPRERAAALGTTVSMPAPSPAASLTGQERRFLCVVVADAPREARATMPRTTVSQERSDSELRAFQDTGARFGAEVVRLLDGSMLATLKRAGNVADQAVQAAQLALAVQPLLPGVAFAIATGLGDVSTELPVGQMLDRAASLLRAPADTSVGRVLVDEVTAGLLSTRFVLRATTTGNELLEERAAWADARLLLGRPTPCLGRDREIDSLAALFTECMEEPRAHAALVTAPAGMGKTRMAHELLRRLRSRDEPILVWIGRGDPMRKGAALGLLGQALAGALGIRDGEPIEARRETIRARVVEDLGGTDARRVAEFLGEIVGTPFTDEDSLPLRAARQNAQLMGDQMRRAWVDFIDARCAKAPVLVVLEDLHWGDLATVRFIDEALRRLKEKPWMVLALARPEVHEIFPGLWAERNVHEVSLGGLSRRAGAKLVRLALGDRVSAETVERLVTQADGNAFHLEELIRAAAEGNEEALPETVLAMIQGRIESLDADARKVLRAASVLGQTFWQGAVEAMLGGASGQELDQHIERLERLEWIHERPEAKFQGERELCFRHVLVREAAYAMLTNEDRALGHRLAAAWLSQVGEPSAAAIAEHFERGGDPARAADAYRQAAAQALAANDLEAVLSWSERALRLAPSSEARGAVALLRAEGLYWRGEIADAGRWAFEALGSLPEGSAGWYMAAGEAAAASSRLETPDRLVALADAVASTWSEASASAIAVVATAQAAKAMFSAGLYDRAEALHARLEAVAPRFSNDPLVIAHFATERMLREYHAGRFDESSAHIETAIACCEQAGDLRNASRNRVNLGSNRCLLGAYAEAAELLRATHHDAERMGLTRHVAGAQHNLGMALLGMGAFEEARAMEARAVEVFAAVGDRRMESASRAYLARILLRMGELAAAEEEARRAVERTHTSLPINVLRRATLAEVLLARGQPAEALAEARAATAMLDALGRTGEGETLARLTHAEALHATGDHASAHAAMARARDGLLAQAALIRDPARRKTFLENVPENARTLALAREWLDGPMPTATR